MFFPFLMNSKFPMTSEELMDDMSTRHEVIDWIAARRSILVVTHERPDGDAFGSLYGIAAALKHAGKNVVAYHETPVPQKFSPLLDVEDFVFCDTDIPECSFDGILCVDSTSVERTVFPKGISPGAFSICNVDHHRDNAQFGECNWVSPKFAAASQQTAKLANEMNSLTPEIATAFMLGIVTDTGGFRFPNTTPEVLRDVALLMDKQADYDAVMDAVFFRISYGRRKLETYLFEHAHFAFDRRLMYAILEKETLAELGVLPEETEGVIDVLRTISSVEVACLVQPDGDDTRFSLRSRSAQFPVNRVANKIGGGGHFCAAGATSKNTSSEQAVEILLKLVSELFQNKTGEYT